jgi:aspartyl-tRNA(Asn)/glutamyl-tRNA(Gln) amidotransferase subunit C
MDKKTVTTIAYLSRLAIDQKNEDKITEDLENIIKFVDQLDSVNTDGINEPLANPLEKTAKTRNDEVTAKNRKETFLERSPKSNDDYFLVPRVVE